MKNYISKNRQSAPRVMLAAPKSGSGKTLIACGLMQAYLNMGKKLSAFKCGPDYIDPMFHKAVLQMPSRNLDSYFADENALRGIFLNAAQGSELSVIEGVMGLYDGLGGVISEASSYHVAKITKTPIILVVDAKGMSRSVLALIEGFLRYDEQHLIKGVLLNRVNKMTYSLLKPMIESELSVKVVGYFPEQKNISLESRHLGLIMPNEIEDLKEQLALAANVLSETADLDEILEIASKAEMLEYTPYHQEIPRIAQTKKAKIGVAYDDAFCFYYDDNLELLEELGAELVFFSPLNDAHIPDGVGGLLLGGGYPELYARKLSENASMRRSIKAAIDAHMPSVAECGGFMYLHEGIVAKDGNEYKMAGVLPAKCAFREKLVRFGYACYEAGQDSFLKKGEKIKGHEFHYFDSEMSGASAHAVKPVSGREYDCVVAGEEHWWGFPHLYYRSNPEFVRRFVEAAEFGTEGK